MTAPENNTIAISGQKIGPDTKPFIIAEMSGNHNQSLDRAFQIVSAAADTGADAIKLQTYTADTITLDVRSGEFNINDADNLWTGKNLHDLYNEAHTPWEWHKPIMEHAAKLGLICFSSPFDETAVDFLETLNAPAYKIASFENSHLPLIRKVAATGKPMIMSTGMASIAELDEAVSAARASGCKDLILLKCTSTYPATPQNSNVLTIPHMKNLFGCQIGLSDHTMGTGVAVAAVAHGASVVEKHFTLSRADCGVDSAFSLEPAEFSSLVVETERAWQSLGKVTYGPTQAEVNSLAYRRSIYIASDVKQGDILTSGNMRILRPGKGLHPRFYEQLLGRKAAKDLPKGTPIDWNLVQ